MQTQRLTVEEICMKLKPVFGRKIDEVYLRYAMAETREEKEEIEHILNALYHKHLAELLDKKVLLEPPAKEFMNGEYPLAMISYANKKLYPFVLREKDWIRHFCISGMSGSGKTTLAFHIISNFIQKGKPFLIFDWKKSFRPLMTVDNELMCFTVGNENVSNLFKININQPPEGVSAKEWINVLCDLITESFFASYGVHKVLLETLDEAFKDFGVYSGSRNYPTWNEIKWRLENRLEKTKGRTATWLESALRIAHVLTFGNFGKALNYKGKESLTIEDLLKRKVLFELNVLGNIEKKFFCEFVLTYIYKLRKAKQLGISQNFEHAILVDEAHNIFLKDKTHFVKESVTDVIYREMREYGTSLICLDQHISKISDTVAGNSACHVAFQQQLPQDIETISGLMQLRDRKQFFSMLPVGSAIVKLSERYTLPFLVEVSEAELRNREFSDKDIAQRMKFIFEGRAIEQGADPEFGKALMQTEGEAREEEEIIERQNIEKPRAPNHALFSGEMEKFRELGSMEIDHSFKNLDKLQEIPRELIIDSRRETESAAGNMIQKKEEKPEKAEEKVEEKAKEIEEQKIEEPAQITEEIQISLDNVQQILYEFVEKKLAAGRAMKEIEKILDEHAIEGGYSIIDVSKVINFALENQFRLTRNMLKNAHENTYKSLIKNTPKSVTTIKKQKLYKEGDIISKQVVNEEITEGDGQERFLAFLQNNPNHNYSTIEIYKKLGLSARKGNKIKNKLMEKKLIKVEEQKNSKGWKKIIKLAE